MLALVTCHIFPPSIWYGKNEFLAPDFPADSSQFFRVHGFTSAVRQMPTAMRNPFAWTNVSSGKNACFAFGHTLEQNSSICPIISYLWVVDLVMRFFPVGPAFEDHPQVFSHKRSSPLNFIFDTCASASWSHLFWLVKLNICGCTPFARTNVFSEKKRLFCTLGALTQNSWIRPIMS